VRIPKFWEIDPDPVANQEQESLFLRQAPSGRGSYSFREPKAIGQDILLIWTENWRTPQDDSRTEIRYQLRGRDGTLVKDSAALQPVEPDTTAGHDDYSPNSILSGGGGKVWIAYDHFKTAVGRYTVNYLILGADGNMWKGPVETTAARYFNFCDRDGYIWATEGDKFFALNPDDTITYGPRTPAWIPNQNVGCIAALVETDGYRLYDRWSPQTIQINVPSDVKADCIELFDLNMWNNDLHAANLRIKKGDTVVWSQTGQFTGHATVDLPPGTLPEGGNVLTATQDDFLGGHVLFTFPYVLPPPPPFRVTEILKSAAAMIQFTWNSESGKTYTVLSSTDLLEQTWNEEATVPSQGETTTWVDLNATSPAKFYKVRRN